MAISDNDVYIFIYIERNEIYAATSNKKYAKQFRNQRNMKYFKMIKVKEYETRYYADNTDNKMWKDYTHNKKNRQLVHRVLSDGKNLYKMVMTVGESNELDTYQELFETCLNCYSELSSLYEVSDETVQSVLKEIHFSSKEYYKIMDSLTMSINKDDWKLDELKLFYRLFEYTFTEVSHDNDFIVHPM
jgi:hypothetical protein